jgi:hypothetical protein
VACLGIAALFGTEHGSLLLRFADEHHALCRSEPGQMLLHDVVLTLALVKRHDRHLVVLGELLHRRDEIPRHRIHQRRRGKLLAAMPAEELHHAAFIL